MSDPMYEQLDVRLSLMISEAQALRGKPGTRRGLTADEVSFICESGLCETDEFEDRFLDKAAVLRFLVGGQDAVLDWLTAPVVVPT